MSGRGSWGYDDMITEAMKAAIPPVLYGCAVQECAGEVSHHPEDLYWWDGGSEIMPGFYCADCLGHWCAENRGPSLKVVLGV